uniref:Reverse transcriptase domain-containing protein n=1 Tax=Tanacetum cinerariifolium TaxID=118510 RepID=A0A6L2NJ69_TANCI|nr:hypothetical protein [Tanacetum cinerariifolium]
MATEPEEAGRETLRRLRRELLADVELTNNLLYELNRYLDQLCARAPELLRVKALPDDPLIKYAFKELRLCFEDEERMRLEQEKIIEQEKSFRLEEAKRIRLKEEKMLQIADVNKRKRHEFMNSTHVKNILAKLIPLKRNDVHSVTGKTKSKEIWLIDDIEQFIGQPRQLKCLRMKNRLSLKNDMPPRNNKELLTELRNNAYNEAEANDAVDHITRFLEIIDLVKIPNVSTKQLCVLAFPYSLTGKSRRWWMHEGNDKITSWVELVDKFFYKYYPLSRASKTNDANGYDNNTLIDDEESSNDESNHDTNQFFDPYMSATDEVYKDYHMKCNDTLANQKISFKMMHRTPEILTNKTKEYAE